MNSLMCEKCGGNDLRREGGYLVCAYCGTKYVIDSSNRPVKQSNISLNSDIKALLKKCREEPEKARKYANLILDIDPGNQDALKYL